MNIGLNKVVIQSKGKMEIINGKGDKVAVYSEDKIGGYINITTETNILNRPIGANHDIDIKSLPDDIKDKLDKVFAEIENFIQESII